MGRRWGFIPFVGILASVLAFAPLVHARSAPADDVKALLEDKEEGWGRTSTDFSLLMLYTNQLYPCQASEIHYLGCVQLINGIGRLNEPQQLLLPKDIQSKIPAFKGEIVATSGDLALFKVTDLGVTEKVSREFADNMKLREQMLREAAFANYNRRLAIDFDSLASSLIQTRKDGTSAQYAIGSGVNALILVHDGHGKLDVEEYLEAEMNQTGEAFFGIGAVLQPVDKKGAAIIEVLSDSPAEKAGIRIQDVIVKVDGKEVGSNSLSEIVDMIRGPANTEVRITVERRGQVLEVPVPRGQVKFENVRVRIVEDLGVKLATIRLGQFNQTEPCQKIKSAIRSLPSDVKGLVLDLRGNPGGLLSEAICIGGLFLGKKTIVLERKIQDGVTSQNAIRHVSDQDQVTELPMVVMINNGSASASEIVSGAIQDYRRGWIVGTTSFGKATVQTVKTFRFQPELLERTTTARFYQPSDRTNQVVGIQPDFEVFFKPNPTEEEKFVMREADLVPSALPPAGAAWTQPRPTEVAKVNTCLAEKRSETIFNARDGQGDYQTLVAQEVLACDLGLAPVITLGRNP